MYHVTIQQYVFIFKSRGDGWFIEDETGKQLPALIVFCESLKFLKQSLLEEAKKQQTDIGVYDIKWILTVPAIWSDPAKSFMRRAAIEVYEAFVEYLKEKKERKKEIDTLHFTSHVYGTPTLSYVINFML